MKNATLCLLVKEPNGEITDICLAMKKRGFGEGLWNGSGGKVNPEESVEQAAIRELKEEIDVDITEADLEKVGELDFIHPEKPEWNQVVHAFVIHKWNGEPKESEEMKPQWFKVADIPYASMWEDDIHWIPLVLAGKKLKAEFEFSADSKLLKYSISEVGKF